MEAEMFRSRAESFVEAEIFRSRAESFVLETARILLEDPSEYRPEYALLPAPMPSILVETGKPIEEFRHYNPNPTTEWQKKVKKTYTDMHTKQTVEFVKGRQQYWGNFDKKRMTVMEALDLLNSLIDESDPDNTIPNIVHAFQTAERIRAAWPDHDWFHLTGLLHDLGKVMACWGEDQFAVVGDTFPVGCRYGDSIVFREDTFDMNPDYYNPLYQSKNGIYDDSCGLKDVMMSWGHDEYLYRVMVHNQTTLPQEALYMIRFHSFYPWHTGKDYMHLCDDTDKAMLPWVLEFNKFDLYSKSDEAPDIEALKPYYQSLIDKYIPGVLKW